ncbi:MAG: hypothetical protein A3J79_04540 [Elusimicrobia bacterium RIFOXYB2_FULL_62_6]|nr:MAG: hypothetical protein A3J79_04540 [Elusimicrobia bacterium RIFOXYB2_FULL_62_6]
MPQYYIPPDQISDGVFCADEDESAHITKAARKRAGDGIEIFDGRGNRYAAVIGGVRDGLVTGKIGARLDSPVYRTRLTLCFAPVSRAAAEEVLEHATEAGVAAFQPVLCSRSQFDWFETWQDKERRFRNILTAACKQCGRAAFPELLKPQKFDDALAGGGGEPALVAVKDAPDGFEALIPGLAGAAALKVFIGPEGGFTKGELEFAAASGAKFFSLGKYTLRAETAAAAAAVVILNRLG